MKQAIAETGWGYERTGELGMSPLKRQLCTESPGVTSIYVNEEELREEK